MSHQSFSVSKGMSVSVISHVTEPIAVAQPSEIVVFSLAFLLALNYLSQARPREILTLDASEVAG